MSDFTLVVVGLILIVLGFFFFLHIAKKNKRDDDSEVTILGSVGSTGSVNVEEDEDEDNDQEEVLYQRVYFCSEGSDQTLLFLNVTELESWGDDSVVLIRDGKEHIFVLRDAEVLVGIGKPGEYQFNKDGEGPRRVRIWSRGVEVFDRMLSDIDRNEYEDTDFRGTLENGSDIQLFIGPRTTVLIEEV